MPKIIHSFSKKSKAELRLRPKKGEDFEKKERKMLKCKKLASPLSESTKKDCKTFEISNSKNRDLKVLLP